MKAYVNTTTGEVHELHLQDDAVVDVENNRVGKVTFLHGLPEGEIVTYDPDLAREEAGDHPDYDSTYQQLREVWEWDNSAEKMNLSYEVIEWRTQAEAEAEAAAAALDVTPDSA